MRRAVLAAAVLALVAWMVVVRLGQEPQADRPPPRPDVALAAAPVYRPTPLNGSWVHPRLTAAEADAITGTRPGQRLTVDVGSTALLVSVGSPAEPRQRIIGYEAIFVEGDRVQLNPIGYPQRKAVYRWDITADRLTLPAPAPHPRASPAGRLVTEGLDRRVWRPGRGHRHRSRR